MDLKDAKDAETFLKLFQEPFETGIELEGQTPIPVWVHNITPLEDLHVAQCWGEAYKWLRGQEGSEEASVVRFCNIQSSDMTMFYAIRKGPEKNSPRLFGSVKEYMKVPIGARLDLYGKYADRFVPTEEDLGNSLRARIDGSGTTSNSPAVSPVN